METWLSKANKRRQQCGLSLQLADLELQNIWRLVLGAWINQGEKVIDIDSHTQL